MDSVNAHLLRETRRQFLGRATRGIGSMALASLLNPGLLSAAPAESDPWRGLIQPLHTRAKAKRIIYLYMAGGPSHLETFDFKPELIRLDGQPMPESFTKGEQVAQLQGQELRCMGAQFPFARHGQCGHEMTSLFPHMAAIADELCIIKSMQTEQINHDPAHTFMNSGTAISGRPSMGSWMLYGLGSECENLPGFVVMTSWAGRSPQPVSTRQWHSGFLPSKFQGVQFHSKGDPVHYIGSPAGVNDARQRDIVDAVQTLNGYHDEAVDEAEIATRISQYEMAFRMQTSVPDLVEIRDEPQHILDMYGTQGADGTFAFNCLLARRMAERGVRFIQLYHRGWDHHNDLKNFMEISSGCVDQATAALVKDLKQRGMLEDTLIIWGGEFGRTPMVQADKGGPGRDHHIKGFSMCMAGGGIKPGFSYGETDELGYNAVKDVVSVHDFHATILHQMGIDHKKLTYRYQGRDFRLTDVAGNVVKGILA
ncbi:MAG: DUF1501 domain-containing protein [Candidatus Hydrogenedentes bacterium]|nr:DUF1501 domain-containing protein [Candidatus Hydrogenedentota bacterium]